MPKDILKIFQDSGALLQGHFFLSSGLHSQQYLQCARVLEDPQTSAKLCQTLAEDFKNDKITIVIGPAMGGVILAYELARALGARALFAERETGKMCLRRNFTLSSQDKVLVAEDVVTTGGSVKGVMEVVKSFGAKIVGIAALIDRSNKKSPFGKLRFKSLEKMNIKTYKPKSCPLCKKKVPLVKPGSRDPSLRSVSS